MKPVVHFAVALACASVAMPAPVFAKPTHEGLALAVRLDAQVPGVLRAANVPSLSIVILRKGKPILTRAWGEHLNTFLINVATLIADGLVEASAALAGSLVLTLKGRLLADAVVRRLI